MDEDDRHTSAALVAECAALAGVDGFDLDVAASPDNAVAPLYFTHLSDGLRQRWFGRVWCNPPYSDIGPWVAKAHQERPHCDVIVLLLPSTRTEQPWWQTYIEPQRLDGSIKVHFLAVRRGFGRSTVLAGWPRNLNRPRFGLAVVII